MFRILFTSIIAVLLIFIIPIDSSIAVVCGDVNCSDPSGNSDPDISDIVRLIDYLYLSKGKLCNPIITDVTNSGGDPDISDIVRLIDYLYLTHKKLECPLGTITDIDGNGYHSITICEQEWMLEDLKVTHYRNGDPIPNVTDNIDWINLSTGAYCNYENDESFVALYGRLYNWYAISDNRNIAPEGWHVPSDEEWKQLEICLGMSQAEADETEWRGTDEGGKLKEALTIHWKSPNMGATNETGFNALPSGFRNQFGIFLSMGDNAYFWTTTEINFEMARYRTLSHAEGDIGRFQFNKISGFSVRCVRDVIFVPEVTTASVTDIRATAAQCGGNVTWDGGSVVSARGVCWSMDPAPTIADDKTIDGTGMGNFSSSITGLAINSTYFVRAYATNEKGTAYGDIREFTTLDSSDYRFENDIIVPQTSTNDNQIKILENQNVPADGQPDRKSEPVRKEQLP